MCCYADKHTFLPLNADFPGLVARCLWRLGCLCEAEAQSGFRRCPLAHQLWSFSVCRWKSGCPLRTAAAEGCERKACVSGRNAFDVEQCTRPSGLASVADWQRVSVTLHGELHRSSTHPLLSPADLLFMLCGLATDLWQDQCLGSHSECPKERQIEESGLASDSPCARLITAASYQCFLICQRHTAYSSASSLCFTPLDQCVNLFHPYTPPLFMFYSKSLSGPSHMLRWTHRLYQSSLFPSQPQSGNKLNQLVCLFRCLLATNRLRWFFFLSLDYASSLLSFFLWLSYCLPLPLLFSVPTSSLYCPPVSSFMDLPCLAVVLLISPSSSSCCLLPPFSSSSPRQINVPPPLPYPQSYLLNKCWLMTYTDLWIIQTQRGREREREGKSEPGTRE